MFPEYKSIDHKYDCSLESTGVYKTPQSPGPTSGGWEHLSLSECENLEI